MQKFIFWHDFPLLSIDERRQHLQAIVQNTNWAHIERLFTWVNMWLCLLVLCVYFLFSMRPPGLLLQCFVDAIFDNYYFAS